MLIRSIHDRRLFSPPSDVGGAPADSGGTPPANQPPAAEPPQNQQQDQLDLDKSIWQADKQLGEPAPTQQAPTQQQQQQQPPQQTYEELIKSITPDVAFTPEVMQAAASGDLEGFNTAVSGSLQTLAGNVMQKAFEISKGITERAVNDLRAEFGKEAKVTASRASLQETVELAKDPQFAPILEAVKVAMMQNRGLADADANTAVGKFVTYLQGKINDQQPPQGDNPFNQQGPRLPDTEEDFVALISGGNKTQDDLNFR